MEEPIFQTHDQDTFRPVAVFGKELQDWKRVNPYWIGFYDPGNLAMAQDPLTELLMETYRPESAEWVLDAAGKEMIQRKRVRKKVANHRLIFEQ